MRDPLADAYLMIQDDALVCDCRELRIYLESVLWPGSREGLASLFCSQAYTRSRPGWYRFRRVWKWGAQAFVFSPAPLSSFCLAATWSSIAGDMGGEAASMWTA